MGSHNPTVNNYSGPNGITFLAEDLYTYFCGQVTDGKHAGNMSTWADLFNRATTDPEVLTAAWEVLKERND